MNYIWAGIDAEWMHPQRPKVIKHERRVHCYMRYRDRTDTLAQQSFSLSEAAWWAMCEPEQKAGDFCCLDLVSGYERAGVP